MAGFEKATVAILATMGVGVVNILSTIVAIPLVDSWGRRPLLLLGIIGMSVGLIGLTFLFDQRIRLQTINTTPIPPLNIKIFEQQGNNLFSKEIATSGEYVDSPQVKKKRISNSKIRLNFFFRILKIKLI